MTLTNATNYRTADLRVIVSRVCQDELADFPDRRKRLHVQVVHTHGRPEPTSVSGVAWKRFCWVRLRIPRTGVDPVAFAWLAAHEIAHVRGMGHRKMPAYLNHFTATSLERWGWAAGFPIRQAEPAAKPDRATVLQTKRDHAARMLRAADTRLKLATTIRAKWARRLKAADRALAAAVEPLRTDGGLDWPAAAGDSRT